MKIQFEKSYDVVVAGAGIAGISAALAAAGRGHSVCLLEKQTLIGGLATAGMIFVYLPLCDGEGRQVTFGLAEKLIRQSVNYGPFDLSVKWGGNGEAIPADLLAEGAVAKSPSKPRERFACHFTPAGYILQLDAILKEHNVDLWLDTLLCDVQTIGARVTALEVENASGRGVIRAGCFVDATGDAGIVRRAGGPVIAGNNRNSAWFIGVQKDKHCAYSLGDSVLMETVKEPACPTYAAYESTGRHVTEFVRTSWQSIRDHYAALYSQGHDRFSAYPLALASMPQFRKILRIDGCETIHAGEENRRVEDSIGMIGDWRHAGKVWETPWGALLPKVTDAVIAAGRCIASDDDAWEAYRVIPAGAMTGEVAGTAAALAVENDILPRNLPLAALKAELAKAGFQFHRAP